ncbi:methyl-accepting chemotaxis protein [Desulfobulbus rhabdoformis]|uniref:methyl-accepting chemotaxis protein n=1 Tax=Desulfobulbus rhabdoformis TaxID=34032 RepID=UPI0019626FFD|nr:methyl-accepting chemotaxis protein [Desulfobulbus rhabdoformis]MBM9615925.1 methyl-accepting chemotaxis protein [Desulfobulbus rhabdoformis]
MNTMLLSRFFAVKQQAATAATPQKTGWLTVGLKLILGVALASNTCIAALLYINHGSTQRVEAMMGEVLTIRDTVDRSLRDSIVGLQKQFTDLPKLFINNPTLAILDQVEQEFKVENRRTLVGREQYRSLYKRAQKRDLAKGKFVIGLRNEKLELSHGLFDEAGTFTKNVEQLTLHSQDPHQDQQRLEQIIRVVIEEGSGIQFYEKKVAQLAALVTDKSLEAEQSRTQILSFVDRINQQEQKMNQAMERQQYQSLYAGLSAVLINILALSILTRIIIERPINRLSSIVEALSSGEFPEIPWKRRRDQIGSLCNAMDRFRTALLRLKRVEQRKAEDQQKIKDLATTMTQTIGELSERSTDMAQVAHTMQALAGQTQEASSNVAELADDTARLTTEVNDSSLQINTAVGEIHTELGVQNKAVETIVGEIGQARQQLMELHGSVTEIDTIIGTVHAITDQTKILALNATIEAVKAGEYGRGFAVVAGEVKKLSQDTALATGDILGKIEAINHTCDAFLKSFDAIGTNIDALHGVTAIIDQAIGQQRQFSTAIVALTGSAGENTLEVSTRITEVSTAAAKVLQHAETTSSCAREIASELGTLLSGSVRSLDAVTS